MRGSLDQPQVEIHYEFLPAPGKSVLVLSNSLGTDLSMWSPQMSALTDKFAVLRYDTRGHGASSCPPGPYSIGDLGKDLLGLLDRLDIERAHICGISMGGLVAQWLGIYAPERVQSLILANTAAKVGTSAGWDDRIHTVMQDGMSAIVAGVLQRWYTPPFLANHASVADHTAAMLRSTDPAGYAACCVAIRDLDLRNHLHQITAPALVIFGAYDTVTTGTDAIFLRDHIPNAACVQLKAAHLSNIESATEFTEALLSFLTRLETSR